MAITAQIPVEDMATANATLEAAGFGPGNFSVPLSNGVEATHAMLHCGGRYPAFETAVQSIPNAVVTFDAASTRNWEQHLQGRAEQPIQIDFEDTVTYPQSGDTRVEGGKTWISLIDNNVWPVPIGWREDAAAPDWLQPVGSLDAYPTGAVVTFNGNTYTNNIPFNTRAPNESGWTLNEATDAWTPGTTYQIDDEVTHEGTTYRARQLHTAQSIFPPPLVPALWQTV